jgi:hypothetical protein
MRGGNGKCGIVRFFAGVPVAVCLLCLLNVSEIEKMLGVPVAVYLLCLLNVSEVEKMPGVEDENIPLTNPVH